MEIDETTVVQCLEAVKKFISLRPLQFEAMVDDLVKSLKRPLSVIPAYAEILKRYIILHLEPVLLNTEATGLDKLKIWLCVCKIKYGGITWLLSFWDEVFSTFYGLFKHNVQIEDGQVQDISAIINLTFMPPYAILLSDYPMDNHSSHIQEGIAYDRDL